MLGIEVTYAAGSVLIAAGMKLWDKMGMLECPECGTGIGTTDEVWECRTCPTCGLLVFKK